MGGRNYIVIFAVFFLFISNMAFAKVERNKSDDILMLDIDKLDSIHGGNYSKNYLSDKDITLKTVNLYYSFSNSLMNYCSFLFTFFRISTKYGIIDKQKIIMMPKTLIKKEMMKREVLNIKVAPDNKKVAFTISNCMNVFIFDLENKDIDSIDFGQDRINLIEFSNNNRYLAIGGSSFDNQVYTIGVFDKKFHDYIILNDYDSTNERIDKIAFNGDSSKFFIGRFKKYWNDYEMTIKKGQLLTIFDLKNRKLVFENSILEISNFDDIMFLNMDMFIYTYNNFIYKYCINKNILVTKEKLSMKNDKYYEKSKTLFFPKNRYIQIKRNTKKKISFLIIGNINTNKMNTKTFKNIYFYDIKISRKSEIACIRARYAGNHNKKYELLIYNTKTMQQIIEPIRFKNRKIHYDIAPSGKFIVYIRDGKLYKRDLPPVE